MQQCDSTTITKSFQKTKEKIEKVSFQNPIHCCQTNSHFGGREGNTVALFVTKGKKLSHVMSVNTDTLNRNLTVRQCYALMAGKLTPCSHYSPHQWNQAPVTMIYQGKIKGREGLGERHNPKAEQSK